MKYLKQFFIIIFISFLGEILHAVIPLPVPASIYGIILLFAGLMTGMIPLASVREVGTFLIEIMPVMFVPAAVGLIESWEILRDKLIAYVAVTFLTTVIVMAVTGLMTQKVIRGRKEQGNDQ